MADRPWAKVRRRLRLAEYETGSAPIRSWPEAELWFPEAGVAWDHPGPSDLEPWEWFYLKLEWIRPEGYDGTRRMARAAQTCLRAYRTNADGILLSPTQSRMWEEAAGAWRDCWAGYTFSKIRAARAAEEP